MDKPDIFSFGYCKGCGNNSALKNDYCENCNKTGLTNLNELFPFGFDDLFKKDK